MSAREYYSGRHIRMWREELLALHRAPFDVGPEALFVAFYASAEIGCFLELGWDLPVNTLDLFAEHRCATNGRPLPMGLGNGLLDVLTLHGLGHIDAGEKKTMRDLAIRGAPFTSEEQTALQDYCDADTAALMALLPRMAPFIDWKYALPRGRYMRADARMCRAGIPVDVTTGDVH
jgi:DNA polymerase I